MKELILQERVVHQGRSFKGHDARIDFEPNPARNGWIWVVGGHEVPITPDTMESRQRRVALVYQGNVLEEFEHIGILRAAGIQHVRLWSPAGTSWPPYDGCSFALWNAVMQHVHEGNTLTPYRVPCGHVAHQLPKDIRRSVSYTGNGNDHDVLRMTGLINFARLDENDYRFGHVYPRDDLRTLMRARTLGWPPSLWYVSRLASKFGWPHHKNIVWPQEMLPSEMLEETGRHRLLDMLAVFNFVAPAGTYLAGSLHSCMGNHATDLGVLKKLWTVQKVRLKEAA